MLYALYGQETSYGKNVGKTEREWSAFCANRNTSDCRNWKQYDCKADNKNAKFYDDILRLLGYADSAGNADRGNIPTSSTCALGFTQFEPATWWLVSSPHIDKTYDPWNIQDAVLMTAYYLKDRGANGEEILGPGEVIGAKDRIALQQYYCGSNYQRLACQEYAASIEIKARNALETLLQAGYKKQLERLEQERQQLHKDLGTVVAVPLGCKEVPTEEFGFGVQHNLKETEAITPLLDKATRDLLNAYRIYRAAQDKNLLKEIQQFGEARKTYFVKSLYLDPSKTLFSLLLAQDREEISRLVPQCIEEEITLEGMIDALHIDFEEGSSETQYTLITDEGNYVTLHPAGGLYVPLESGMRVRIKGVRIDKEILFDGTRSLLEPHDVSGGIDVIKEVGNPPVTGEQKVLVVMVNFQNTKEPSLTKEAVRNIVFGEVDRYYREISYDTIFLTGDVLGWYPIPLKQSCNTTLAKLEAIRAVDSFVDFRNYGRLFIVAPFGPSCGWGGLSDIGKKTVRTSDGNVLISSAGIRSATFSTVAHELGHQFGTHHADSLMCKNVAIADSGCVYDEYGDPYDIMGNRVEKHVGHMNALHKENLGWLGEKTLKQISASGLYTLEPIEMAGDGLKAIKIQRKRNDFLYVEYRQPLGFDTVIGRNSNVFEGALLHVRKPDGDARRSALIDPTPPGDISTSALLPGMIFQDPASGAVVSTVSRTPRSLTLRVTAGKKDFTLPQVSITYPSGQPTVSGIINVRASATHRVGIERVDFYYVKQGSHILFGTDRQFPYESELDTQQLLPGLNYVFAKAYDSSGNERVSTIEGFYVTTPDREAPNVVFVAPQEGEVLKNPITFRADATDDIGIAFVVFTLDAGLPEEQTRFDYHAPFSVSAELGEGFHTVYAQAQDAAGKTSRTDTVSFEVVQKDKEITDRSIPVPEVKKKIVEKKAQISLPKNVAHLSEGRVGVSYTATLTSSEGTPPYTWEIPISPGRFPSGLSLIRETGVISGTPKESGVWSFYANFYDADGKKGIREFGIEIKPAVALIIDTNLSSGIVGSPYKVALSASGLNPPYTWSSPSGYGQFPPGLNLSSSGIISGIPSQAGTWIFNVNITDASGQDIIEEFGIEIVSPLEIKTADLSAGLVDSYYSATFEASGTASPPYRWSVLSGRFPPGLELNSHSGYISGTPHEAGSWVFIAKVENAQGVSATKELRIDVRAPLLIPDPLPAGTVRVAYNAIPSVIGGVAPYRWSIESGTLPVGFSLNESSGKIRGQ